MKVRIFPLFLAAATLVAFGAGCKKATTNTNDESNVTIVNNDDSLNSNLDINAILDNGNSNENANLDLNTNASDTNANTNASTNLNTNVSANLNTNTSANTNAATSSTGDITITLPAANAVLVSPFYVQGTATSGTSVFARVRSAGGAAIFTESISVNNHAFKGKLLFDFTSTKAGSIEVFQKDASGSEINQVTIPVTFTLSNSNTNSAVNGNSNTNS